MSGTAYRSQRDTYGATYPPFESISTGQCKVKSTEAELDRIEAWMKWKSSQMLVNRVKVQLLKATKRGSKGTTLALDDVHALLALAPVVKP